MLQPVRRALASPGPSRDLRERPQSPQQGQGEHTNRPADLAHGCQAGRGQRQHGHGRQDRGQGHQVTGG